jgi:hypothetical protein
MEVFYKIIHISFPYNYFCINYDIRKDMFIGDVVRKNDSSHVNTI